MTAWQQRRDGDESPYIPLGPFKLRLPFIHYRFELPDYLQGLLMCAVDLAAIPLMVELLGMPFEAAIVWPSTTCQSPVGPLIPATNHALVRCQHQHTSNGPQLSELVP